MDLLDNFPHTATAKRRKRTKDEFGGSTDSFTTTFTAKKCWMQQAGAREVTEFEKKGISVTHKVYFLTDTALDERDVLYVTDQEGAVTAMEVRSYSGPDASAGLGVVYKVMTEKTTTGSTVD